MNLDTQLRGVRLRNVVAKVLDCGIVINEFELQS